jgi:hypothetical protein
MPPASLASGMVVHSLHEPPRANGIREVSSDGRGASRIIRGKIRGLGAWDFLNMPISLIYGREGGIFRGVDARGGRRFGHAELQRRSGRQAARHFSRLRMEDLGRLQAQTVTVFLEEDELGVAHEDEVYQAVGAYVSARDSQGAAACGSGGAGGNGVGGRQLTGEERQALWGCCRFAYCSIEVKAALIQLPEAAGRLMKEFLLGVVAREGREAGAVVEGFEGLEGGRSSQTRARAKLVCVSRSGSIPLFSTSICFVIFDDRWVGGGNAHHTQTHTGTHRDTHHTHTTHTHTRTQTNRHWQRERGREENEREREREREKGREGETERERQREREREREHRKDLIAKI